MPRAPRIAPSQAAPRTPDSRGRHLGSLAGALLLGAALAGCSGSAEVEIETHVGDDGDAQAFTRALEAGRERVARFLETRERDGLRAAMLTARDSEDEDVDIAALITPPRTPEEFADRVEQLRTTPLDNLELPARALARTPATLWPQVRERLLAERPHRKQDYRVLLSLIGGDVPNRYGHFERAWKRAHGHKVKLSEDWYEDLLALDRSRVQPIFDEIFRDCVLETALLQAASTIGAEPERAGEVVDVLLAAAYVHTGTFRDEVGRAIRRIEDPAVPHLLRRSIRPTPPDSLDEKERAAFEESEEVKQAEYAEYQLDQMDRLLPHRAIAAVREHPRQLAALLAAYGARRPSQAAAPLLEFVDAELHRVREAARDAALAYVTGPAPKTRRKTLRLLGGQTTRAKAERSFRDAARLALRARLAEDAPELLPTECELLDERGAIDEACERQPERMAQEYFALLDGRRAAREHDKLQRALQRESLTQTVEELDQLLANNPEFVRRAPDRIELVAPVYEAAIADARAQGDWTRAARTLRKLSVITGPIDAERGRALQQQALLAEAKAPELPREGRRMLLSTASALDPRRPEVVHAIATLERDDTAGIGLDPTRATWLASGLAGLLLLLLGLGRVTARRS